MGRQYLQIILNYERYRKRVGISSAAGNFWKNSTKRKPIQKVGKFLNLYDLEKKKLKVNYFEEVNLKVLSHDEHTYS